MPKVTEEHRAARRQQILHAAWTAFSRNGFHATTMADIIRESGLSAGAVYGYFRSKEELIETAVGQTLAGALAPFAAKLDAGARPDPAEAVSDLLGLLTGVVLEGEIDRGRIVLQAWAESLRNPVIESILHEAYAGMRAMLTEVARRCQQDGRLDADADPEQVGMALFGLLPGYLVQRLVLGASVDDYRAGVAAVLR